MTIDWQDIAAILMAVAAAVYVAIRLRRSVSQKGATKCGGCCGASRCGNTESDAGK